MSDGWRPPAPDPHVGLTDDARLSDAIRSRSEERWLRQQSLESATFAGIARDLAEQGAWVTVQSTTGRGYHGAIVGVGPDHLAVRATTGQTTYLALDAVVGARPDPTMAPREAAGDRGPVTGRRLAEVLALEVADRPRALIVPRGAGEVLRGRLQAIGDDLLTLAVDDRDRAPVFVRLDAVAEIALVDG